MLKHTLAVFVALAALAALSTAQGGAAGGFGGGGNFGQGGRQQGRGGQQNQFDERVRQIEYVIDQVLEVDPVKNILTPGEYSEWPLKLKAGQVVVAEATSEAFDPALEVVKGTDKDAKALATNDDRYPGDQRPLLLWRCTADGDYALRARCFQNRSGGQFALRLKVYDCFDAGETPSDHETHGMDRFFVRLTMKAGQVFTPQYETPDRAVYSPAQFLYALGPTGLPNATFADELRGALGYNVVAPVAGDYYVFSFAMANVSSKVRLSAKELRADEIARDGKPAQKPNNAPALWALSVKKGEALAVQATGTYTGTGFAITERPDFSKFDLTKDASNPFYPPTPDKKDEGPAIVPLVGRARDERLAVFVAKRDAVVWVATSGVGPNGGQFSVVVRGATSEFADARDLSGKLQIGNTDYWSYEAKAGDVVSFNVKANGFAQSVRMIGPDLDDMWTRTANPDDDSVAWNTVAEKPGRYIVAVSAIGDGGGGTYALRRDVIHAKEFKKGSPAVGSFVEGPVQVWKFTVSPGDPVLLHWRSTGGGYDVSVRDEQGAERQIPRTGVAPNEQYGVLSADKPTTYVIVLTLAPGQTAQYRIELLDLPNRGG